MPLLLFLNVTANTSKSFCSLLDRVLMSRTLENFSVRLATSSTWALFMCDYQEEPKSVVFHIGEPGEQCHRTLRLPRAEKVLPTRSQSPR